MAKQVYVPTNEELYLMQDYGVNVYKYLLAKAIETIIMEGVLYRAKGMLRNQYKTIRENEDIARGVCYVYPQELAYSEIARYDQTLCQALLSKSEEKTSLDYLSYFTECTLNNSQIISNVIAKLHYELSNNPQYRFSYQSPNSLLDRIFSCDIDPDILTLNTNTIRMLCSLEPAYVLKDSKRISESLPYGIDKGYLLSQSIDSYGKRYLIYQSTGTEYIGKDILTEPNQDVKRLIRCIKYN